MDQIPEDAGILEALLYRLNHQRLPRLLTMLEKLEGGESLDHFDVDYLQDLINTAGDVTPIIDRHPEYQTLWAQVLGLYKEISDLALQIEKAGTE